MKTHRVIWLSTRFLTSKERLLIYEIHGDEVTIAKDSNRLGDNPDALTAYLERQTPETMVYTDAPTLCQLFHAVGAGMRFGFFEHAEGKLIGVLHTNPEKKKFAHVWEPARTQVVSTTA